MGFQVGDRVRVVPPPPDAAEATGVISKVTNGCMLVTWDQARYHQHNDYSYKIAAYGRYFEVINTLVLDPLFTLEEITNYGT